MNFIEILKELNRRSFSLKRKWVTMIIKEAKMENPWLVKFIEFKMS
jgi:hypothetical protein